MSTLFHWLNGTQWPVPTSSLAPFLATSALHSTFWQHCLWFPKVCSPWSPYSHHFLYLLIPAHPLDSKQTSGPSTGWVRPHLLCSHDSVYITVLTFIYWFLLSPYVSVSLTSSDLEAYLTEGLVHRRSSTYVSWLNEWTNGEWCKLFVIEKCILYSAQHWLIPDLIPDSRLIPESIFRGGIWASAFLWSLHRWIWWATRLQITGLIFGIRLK